MEYVMAECACGCDSKMAHFLSVHGQWVELGQWIALGVAVLLLILLVVAFKLRNDKRRGGRGQHGGQRGGTRGGGNGDFVEIYVGNLSYDMNEAQLRREFEKYGAVKSARIIENRYNKKSKGFGFVEMPVRNEAEAAVKALHDKEIMGRKLRINEAKNKTRD